MMMPTEHDFIINDDVEAMKAYAMSLHELPGPQKLVVFVRNSQVNRLKR